MPNLLRTRMWLRLALLLHDCGKNDRSNQNTLLHNHAIAVRVQTNLIDAFPIFTKEDYAHHQHVDASITIARRALTLQQKNLGLTNDDIDMISLLIKFNDLFGLLFNIESRHHIDLAIFSQRFNQAFSLTTELQSVHCDKAEFLKLLYQVYYADSGTVSTVRRSEHIYSALHADLIVPGIKLERMWQRIEAALHQLSENRITQYDY